MRQMTYFSILFKCNLFDQLINQINDMLYLRQKPANKKKNQINMHQQTKRSVIDELKNKIALSGSSRVNEGQLQFDSNAIIKQKNQRNGLNERPLYQIANNSNVNRVNNTQTVEPEQKIFESIVCKDQQNSILSSKNTKKRNSFVVQKCFDVNILNLAGSRLKPQLQAYINILEKQNKAKDQQIKQYRQQRHNMHSQVQPETAPRVYPNELVHISKINELQNQIIILKDQIENQNYSIKKYHRYFDEGKSVLLLNVMELIDYKNEINMTLSESRIIAKKSSIERCLQLSQKLLSTFATFLQQRSKPQFDQAIIIQQLSGIVKYQQKIISHLEDQDQNNHLLEISLLRHQINRLTNCNQNLIDSLTASKRKSSVSVDIKKQQKNPPKSAVQEYPQSNYQSQQQINKDRQHQTPISYFQNQLKLQEQLKEKDINIQNLKIEKDYLIDQLTDAEHEVERTRLEVKQLKQQQNKLGEELEELKLHKLISQEEINVSMEQIQLLKNKIKIIQAKKQSSPQHFSNKMMEIPEKTQNVTVEDLLKFLNKKQLKMYHQALMQLINHYQNKISELTISYQSEKQIKDKHLTFCKNIYSLAKSKNDLSCDNTNNINKLIKQIAKYDEVISYLRQNQIDILLRKIKSYSIGIDQSQYDNIRGELQEYIYQLKVRLPVLSQEYFQDGSSVADSYHTSVFQEYKQQ